MPISCMHDILELNPLNTVIGDGNVSLVNLLDLGSQLSSVDHKKVSIDGPIGISIDTPFTNIDRLPEDNIDRCF
ncbi:hypothetical protein F2Q70_00011556 [Brassica cretica]|uniref:Uncharacterized protein n=1 Tax=Brassica cretica TaxID=69181 RepID=A0A8S9MD42_BRACR|nr:hypothetical protein F2Q70_00011556 [Brassica cretica]KAF3546062.1 hypothetical protein DY000_02006927 [Brassica cretica]